MACVGSTNFKITKMAGYAKEIGVLEEKGRPEHKEVNKICYSSLPSLQGFANSRRKRGKF